MNKKLIAVAVAGVVTAPAAYAADEPTLSMYGRIDNALEISEGSDGGNTQNLNTITSRFGIRGGADIGNGLSAFAHYEFGTKTDNATSSDKNSGINRRLGYVGMSGPFGSISVGQQVAAYHSVAGNLSQNYWNGPTPLNASRYGNAIKYSNSLGPVSFSLDARTDDDDDGGGNGFGAGFTITPIDSFFLGVGVDNNEDTDRETVGIAGGASFGGMNLVLGHEQGENYMDDDLGNVEVSNTVLGFGASLTDQVSILISYGKKDYENATGGSRDDSNFGVAGTYMIGGGLRLWGEFTKTDTGGVDNPEVLLIGLRMDF